MRMFLPTMPQDDFEALKANFESEDRDSYGINVTQYKIGNDKVVFYRCPKGHVYSIGECGNPAVTGKCFECGAVIGGKKHTLTIGNIKDSDAVARTETGHILGEAQVRSRDPKAERTMTPPTCRIIRLFVHLSMCAAAGNDIKGVLRIITPTVETGEVENFLWCHIQQDIDDIRLALNGCEDDVFTLMHIILNIMSDQNLGVEERDAVLHLSTREGRLTWENQFSSTFLQNTLQDPQSVLLSTNRLLNADQRQERNSLESVLRETDYDDEDGTVEELQQFSSVWRYRAPISLASVRQKVLSYPPDNYKILQLFLREEHFLRALRYIPSILHLHRALLQKYQRRLDKSEAFKITVANLKEESETGDMHRLLDDLKEAWELVRHFLKRNTCRTEFGFIMVPDSLCDESITDTTQVSMLLPTTKEEGLCTFALLDFLFRKQNDFMEKYEKIAKRMSVSTVKPNDVTSAHLISYDYLLDIKPILLANCQYIFDVGEGTKIEYDFAGLERQLIDRFLFSKSKIAVGSVLEIELMVYRTELTNAAVFSKLNEKIPQETLTTSVKAQICDECRSLPVVCQSLINLDIAIRFLTSTGGSPERNLHKFMLETLRMESTIQSQKAQQTCAFKHTKALWLLLSLQKSKLMSESRQNSKSVFESVSEEFHVELSGDLKAKAREYTRKLAADKVAQLLEHLHNYILLVLAVRQKQEEEYTDIKDQKLRDWLFAFAEDDTLLTDFPPGICNKHCVQTWLLFQDVLFEK